MISNLASIFYIVVWLLLIFYARVINDSNVSEIELLVGTYLALSFSLMPILLIVFLLDIQWLARRIVSEKDK